MLEYTSFVLNKIIFLGLLQNVASAKVFIESTYKGKAYFSQHQQLKSEIKKEI